MLRTGAGEGKITEGTRKVSEVVGRFIILTVAMVSPMHIYTSTPKMDTVYVEFTTYQLYPNKVVIIIMMMMTI